MYYIDYTIVASTFVNGVVGDIKITSTNLLFPDTYYEHTNFAQSFVATALYYGNAGSVIIPPDVTRVKMTFKNTKVFFLTSGWASGLNYSHTFDVN